MDKISQKDQESRKFSKTLWTTDTIETILAHFPNDERSILSYINRIWASTVKTLQQDRQLKINRWFSLLQNFYTWRSHTVDTTIMRSLSQAAELHDDGSILHHHTEKGAIISTMQLAIWTTVAYMMEGGGPDHCRKAFCGPYWKNYQSPLWAMPHDEDPNIRFEPSPSYLELFWRRRRLSPNYLKIDEHTIFDLNDQYDPDELDFLIVNTMLPGASAELTQHLIQQSERRLRLEMRADQGPLGHIYRDLLSGSSNHLDRRTLHRLRECATSLGICHLRLDMIERTLKRFRTHLEKEATLLRETEFSVDIGQRMQSMDRDQQRVYTWCCEDLQLNIRIKGWRSFITTNWSYLLNEHITNRHKWMPHPSMEYLVGSDDHVWRTNWTIQNGFTTGWLEEDSINQELIQRAKQWLQSLCRRKQRRKLLRTEAEAKNIAEDTTPATSAETLSLTPNRQTMVEIFVKFPDEQTGILEISNQTTITSLKRT